ncbi:DUF2827 domain-containing protein [Labrys okinawensis]|uniref:DUF2827 domain-containing protein n=1 Tax=Labrys okinawensis TaxID=346911 RepID=UPI0039BC2421
MNLAMNMSTQPPFRREKRDRIRVGVTLYFREGQQSLWENGIFQNCFFLLLLLKNSPLVEGCFIVRGGPGDPAEAGNFLADAPAPVIDLATAMNELDVLIELSAQLDPDWGRQFVARGGRIVGMRVANDFVIDSERMAYGLDPALLMAGVPYHEIWTLPAFERTCVGYYKTGFRAPVRIMQHLWSPAVLERALAVAHPGKIFEYEPGRKRWRCAVLEPNVCSVKTCHLPMLACDVAHRRNPSVIEILRVFGSLAFKEHRDFVAYARSLDLVKQGLATFEGRYPIFEIMGPFADAIVSHHWENAQNYLYYEALYGGYPLIHNSHLLEGCGYSYRNFDPEDAASALLQAFAGHDRHFDDYRRQGRAFLSKLDPLSEANITSYGQTLLDLFAEDKAS